MKKKALEIMVFEHLLQLAILDYAQKHGVHPKFVEQDVKDGFLVVGRWESLDEVGVDLTIYSLTGL